MIKELYSVVLTKDLPEYGLRKGDIEQFNRRQVK